MQPMQTNVNQSKCKPMQHMLVLIIVEWSMIALTTEGGVRGISVGAT